MAAGRRLDLTSVLRETEEPPSQPPEIAPVAPMPAKKAPAKTSAPRRRAAKAPAAAPTPDAEPKYLRAMAKEARLWHSQIADLDTLARDLNRRRGRGVGERITSNTLLRIAASWLLEYGANRLDGVTEEELAASLKLHNYPPPE
jgi:hypothetical protein